MDNDALNKEMDRRFGIEHIGRARRPVSLRRFPPRTPRTSRPPGAVATRASTSGSAASSPSRRWLTTSATPSSRTPWSESSKNPRLREWRTNNLGRLPGLKFMRTLWVCAAAGGPFKYTPTKPGKTDLGLEEAHRDPRISPEEFDEVAAELGRTLDFVKVPRQEKEEVLAAFAAHKNEVTAGSKAK